LPNSQNPQWETGPSGKSIYNPIGTDSMRSILMLQHVCKFFNNVINESRGIQIRLFRLPAPKSKYVCRCAEPNTSQPCTTELNPLIANIIGTDTGDMLLWKCTDRLLFDTLGERGGDEVVVDGASAHRSRRCSHLLPHPLNLEITRDSPFMRLVQHVDEWIDPEDPSCTHVRTYPSNQSWEQMYFSHPPLCQEKNTLRALGRQSQSPIGSGSMHIPDGLTVRDIHSCTQHDFGREKKAGTKTFRITEWYNLEADGPCEHCGEDVLTCRLKSNLERY